MHDPDFDEEVRCLVDPCFPRLDQRLLEAEVGEDIVRGYSRTFETAHLREKKEKDTCENTFEEGVASIGRIAQASYAQGGYLENLVMPSYSQRSPTSVSLFSMNVMASRSFAGVISDSLQ